MTKIELFRKVLTAHYELLFKTNPEYAHIVANTSNRPALLAQNMTANLLAGTGSKDGEGVKRTCKELGINHTYKAIYAFLTTENLS